MYCVIKQIADPASKRCQERLCAYGCQKWER